MERCRGAYAELRAQGLPTPRDGVVRSALDLLAYPEVTVARLASVWPELGAIPAAVAEQIEVDAQYAGYLARQDADIQAFRREESMTLPHGLDYGGIGGLSAEARAKLDAARPATLGAASRIPGITPAALIALLRHVQRRADA